MLHHVALEIAPEQLRRSIELWEIAGFERVAEPDALKGRFVWLEREGTQIHLALVEAPVVPEVGHAAVVAPDLDGVIERLEAGGFEVFEKTSYWGARRVGVLAPGGHKVELMEAPPQPAV